MGWEGGVSIGVHALPPRQDRKPESCPVQGGEAEAVWVEVGGAVLVPAVGGLRRVLQISGSWGVPASPTTLGDKTRIG